VRAAIFVSCQLYQIEQGGDALAHFATRALADRKREGDVLRDGLMRKECVILEDEADVALSERALRDVFTVEDDAPGIGPFEAGDRAQQRGLSATRRPEECGERSTFDRQIDIVERAHGSERFADTAYDDAHELLSTLSTLPPVRKRAQKKPPPNRRGLRKNATRAHAADYADPRESQQQRQQNPATYMTPVIA
jgi:hypothetical protein